MRKIIIILVFLSLIISTVCYAGIRIKPHGGEILDPELSYIVSETVVEDGLLVSDKIIERRLIGVKEVSHPTPSKISKVLHQWGIRLLDMFVCNVDDY